MESRYQENRTLESLKNFKTRQINVNRSILTIKSGLVIIVKSL